MDNFPKKTVLRDTGYETPCWIWVGSFKENGYPAHNKHRKILISRVGYLPPNIVAHHKCHVRACINPDHMEPVPRGEHTTNHLKGKPQSEELKRKRGLALIGNKNSPGSKPCEPGCECGRHKFYGNQRKLRSLT